MKSSGEKKRAKNGPALGINGLGRIGKLSLWHHIARKHFGQIVVNLGRNAGKTLEDVALYIEKDSTYGSLQRYLYGYRAERVVKVLDETAGKLLVDGVPVTVLRKTRNPREIPWKDNGVEVVIEATGRFTDPSLPSDSKEGSVRGHLDAGATKVIVTAPFKSGDDRPLPNDAKTLIMGINEDEYDPAKHSILSAASCTTTCLAHMIKPLIRHFGAKNMLSVFMATAHAATGSQEILDRLPRAGVADLRKTRSFINNIILTGTGAATTLGLVIPEMKEIGFMAESVRVPLSAGSLIILVIAFQDEEAPVITRELLNSVYRSSAAENPYVRYTEEQNVSSDIVGLYGPAALIEGRETRTRTAFVTLDKNKVCQMPGPGVAGDLRIAITQAVVYGWYDNELGSFSNMLGDLTAEIAARTFA